MSSKKAKEGVTPEADAAQAAVSGEEAVRTTQQTQVPDISQILGAVAALMMESPPHQHLFLTDMKWLVIPPVRLRQYRLFRREGLPFAFVSWAMVDNDTEERLKAGAGRLRPDEWQNGDTVWVIDLIAPFGAGDEVLKDLKENVFKGQRMKTRQLSPSGHGFAVVEW